ncbi:MAG: hypothetical protein AB8G22_01305 [Saprospiraceae bacterium]
MKTLNQQAVYHVCELLLLTQQQVSIGAEEVQQQLLNYGYEDDYNYVHARIEDFAAEENWMMTSTGRYCFRDDTDETIDTVLRKGTQMKKFHVLGNVFTTKDLRTRNQQIERCNSNRHAMFLAKEQLRKLVANGYYKM